MVKDSRLITTKHLIETDYIKTFSQLTDHIPVTWLVKLFRTNSQQFAKYQKNPAKFSIEQIFKIADYLEVEESKMIALVVNQVLEERKKKKRKP